MDITKATQQIQSLLGFPDKEALRVIRLWNDLSDFYAEPASTARSNRNFFLGNQWDAADLEKKDRIHRVFNYGSQILRKFQMYEGAKGFDFNVKYGSEDELSVLVAESSESLLYKIIQADNFFLKYLESRLGKTMYGTIFYAPVWVPSDKRGSEKGTLVIRLFTPERCRVLYQDNDYEKAEAFVTIKRMHVDAARRIYGKVVQRPIVPDSEIKDEHFIRAVRDYVFDGSNVLKIYNLNDNHVTVWNYWDTEKYSLIVGDQAVVDKRPHKYKINGEGFCPVEPEHNIYLMGHHVGLSDLHFIKHMLKALNKLYSLLEEIIEDNAYPIMFEINNSLRGKRLKRGENRGKVIPMTIGPNEEGIRTLQSPTIVQPVLAAIEAVKASIFDVSSMPAAAFGAYQPNTKSGFQATVQMQPALQEIDGRHVRTAHALKRVFQMSLAILEAEYPEAVTVTLPEERDPIDGSVIFPEQEIKLQDLSSHEIEFIFGNPLPKDDVRVIQNETAKYSNKLQSLKTTMQNLGVENPSKELDMIEKDDARLAEINAQVQKILTQAQLEAQKAVESAQPQTAGAGNDRGATGKIKAGQNPEQAFPTPQDQKEPAPETAGEAVADTSTL